MVQHHDGNTLTLTCCTTAATNGAPGLGRRGHGGHQRISAWTVIPAILLLVLGKHATWGWSWVQSKTYDPGGSCRCVLPLRPDVAIMGGGAGGRRTMGGCAGGRPTIGGRAAYSGGPNPS